MPMSKISDDVAPKAAVAEVSSTEKKTVTTAVSKNKSYRNISNTLLTLDDGTHFPRNSVAELTEAEASRFQNAGPRHIVPVGGE